MLNDLRYRMRALFRRDHADRALDDELRFHIEALAQSYVVRGVARDEAERRARIEFGGLDRIKDDTRDAWGVSSLETTLQDIRRAAHRISRRPIVSSVVILSLACGIGANVAIFSVVDAALLKPLPVPRPEALVTFATQFPGEARPRSTFAYAAFEKLRDELPQLSSAAAVWLIERSNLTIGGAERPTRPYRVALVSGNYFSTLEVRPSLGRLRSPDDDRTPGGHPVVVISHDVWRRAFGLAGDVVGRTIAVGGRPYTIIGVASERFAGEWIGRPADVWIPLTMQSQVVPDQPGLLAQPNNESVRIIARLRPNARPSDLAAGAQLIYQRWNEDTFSASMAQWLSKVRVIVEPATNGFAPERATAAAPLVVLMVGVALILIICCANVANVLLAQGTARRRELAMRRALGANRSRIVRQLLTETAMLALIGGALGFVLAVFGTSTLAASLAAGGAGLVLDVHPDARAILFTSGVSLLAAMISGIAPALRASNVALAPELTQRGAGAIGLTRRFDAAKALVAVQVGVSLVLLVAAALLTRTARNLETEPLGFDRRGLLFAWVAPGEAGRTGPMLSTLGRSLRERIAAIPGVRSASVGQGGITPTSFLNGAAFDNPILSVESRPAGDQRVVWYVVAPSFFETMGTRRLGGRDLAESDDETAPRVAVINATMARRLFGTASPIGKRFELVRGQSVEIVGVVEDARYISPRDVDRSLVFLPYRQDPNAAGQRAGLLVAIRTIGPAEAMIPAIRQAIGSVDSAVPILRIEVAEQEVARALGREHLLATVAGGFGALALLLACLGLSGLVTYTTSRRTSEIGVRLALGGARSSILIMVLRESVALVVVGLAIGIPVALGGARLLSGLLYGVSGSNAATLAGAASVILTTAAAAAFVPAYRTSRVDPLIVLRHDG